MTYGFSFGKDEKIIELGGGNRPYFRPNVDVRAGENIDIVADFNEPLPLNDEEYDGVVSVYCIEHVSWRKVKLFVDECFRILKVGGRLVLCSPNTEKQMEYILEKEEWSSDDSCMIFGDQDYPENTHKNVICPKYAIKMLSDAGFSGIFVMPHGALGTDMVIEAKKTSGKPKFDREYFDNPLYYGTPEEGMYRDHPNNWIIFNKIMQEKPQSVLEIGCGRGYLLKRFESAGITTKGFDVSTHCKLMRVTNSVQQFDITSTPWPVVDQEFDMCVSDGTLDLIDNQHLDKVLKEIERVSQRGMHKTEKNLNIPNHKFIKKNEFESGSLSFSVPSGDGKIKLNIGSFTVMLHHGWINTDIIDLSQYAVKNQYKFLQMDSRSPFPFESESVDYIVSSHMLEHLDWNEGLNFLRECYRVMKPGAVMRIAVPDLALMVEKYLNRSLQDFDEININAASNEQQSFKFWSFLCDNHKIAYDINSLTKIGNLSGFSVERKPFNEGNPVIIQETMDYFPEISIYVEMTKPS